MREGGGRKEEVRKKGGGGKQQERRMKGEATEVRTDVMQEKNCRAISCTEVSLQGFLYLNRNEHCNDLPAGLAN